VVGNIGSREATLDILTSLERVDAFRVGLSSGSSCITGYVTGVASPTLYSVIEVADALDEVGAKIPVIADGGVKVPGDAVKAFTLGAHTVMIGYLLSRVDEAPGSKVWIGNIPYKAFRGMGSYRARIERIAYDRYSKAKNIVEGVEGRVLYVGNLKSFLEYFTSALKAALGYAGAMSIEELRVKGRVAIISWQGLNEIHQTFMEG